MKNRYDLRRFQRRYHVGLRQAHETGHVGQVAHLMARSFQVQAAISHFLVSHPEDGRALVDLEFEREFSRLLREGDKVWYSRAAASLVAAEVALRHGVSVRWENVIKDAGAVAEANCDGTDEEAYAADRAARAQWRARLSEVLVS